ncbi:MAG TPA: benzoate-CoA ligase family protein [Beijerinckiaceae bacterium]|jgi:benzoate-CoA ligase family protein|nr:benzoate-CoA ligase family protein [Beijerinckiaceae bacterium]
MNAMTMDLTWAPPAGEYNAASDLVDRTVAAGFANKAAFIDPTRQITYRELQQRCNRFANGLHRLGIRREERIALITLDTVDMPVIFWGAIKAGIVPIPINTLLTPEFWTYMIEDSRAAAVVVSAELLDRVGPVLEAIRRQRPLHVIVSGKGDFPGAVSLETFLGEGSDEALAAPTRADEVAFWLYSSGSTGAPKGTRHLHASPMYTARLFAQNVLKFSSEDVVFSAAKLFFAYGLGNSMSFPMSVGATAILLPDRPTPDSVMKVMRDHQPTIFCGVPTLFASMLANKDVGKGAGSDRLRLTTSAGEALPEEIGLRWQEKVGTEVIDGIGSTEMLHIFVSNRPGMVRYGSSGTPVPGYEAKLIDDAGNLVPQGEIGELIIKGPSSAEGYWLQRAKTRRTFCGEWTYTGDKYRIGEDGFYYYCGRTDDMFKVSGIWVSPFEIESVLLTHASVLEAAVVGKEDTDGLVKPKAFVVLKPGAANSETLFEDLKAHVKNNAGAWKYPRWMEVRDDLPKTATGKIQRFKLREES